MNVIDLQIASTLACPLESDFAVWVDAALKGRQQDAELTIRIVDAEESAEFNQQYRGKIGPTNVLSFPFDAPPEVELDLLGDLLMCAPVIVAEAAEQGKDLHHHWAHITIHGVLHLLGYDHIDDAEAELMEALEVSILNRLNIANPYEESSP